MDEAEVVFDAAFIADDEAAEVAEPREQPLHLPLPPCTAVQPWLKWMW
jgi:hypothetical protein